MATARITIPTFGQAAQQPAIPPPTTANLVAATQSLKEVVEIWQGARGDGLDRVLTVRDLLNTQLFDTQMATAVYTGSGQQVPPTIPTTPEEPAKPPTPENLVAVGGVGTIVVTWDFPFEYTRLAYFEVWRSQTDALGDAQLIAKPYANIYADDVNVADTYYYWVRAVSDADTSPFNAVSGTLGQTSDAFENLPPGTSGGESYPAGSYIRDAYVRNGSIVSAKIGDAEITEAKIRDLAVTDAKIADATITAAKIANATITSAQIADATITSAQIADATITGAKIALASITAAQIADATITAAQIANATITAAQIVDATITGAKIADAAITNAKISGTLTSDDWSGVGGSGWALVKSGGGVIYANNIYARGDIQATSLTAGIVYTENIVGAQVTSTYSSQTHDTGGSSISLGVTAPAGSQSLIILMYQLWDGNPSDDLALSVNGVSVGGFRNFGMYAIQNPSGGYSVTCDHCESLVILLTKR